MERATFIGKMRQADVTLDVLQFDTWSIHKILRDYAYHQSLFIGHYLEEFRVSRKHGYDCHPNQQLTLTI